MNQLALNTSREAALRAIHEFAINDTIQFCAIACLFRIERTSLYLRRYRRQAPFFCKRQGSRALFVDLQELRKIAVLQPQLAARLLHSELANLLIGRD